MLIDTNGNEIVPGATVIAHTHIGFKMGRVLWTKITTHLHRTSISIAVEFPANPDSPYGYERYRNRNSYFRSADNLLVVDANGNL